MTTPPILEAGDFVHVDLEPVRGSEQGGMSPALVVSERRFHIDTRRAIVCPITRNRAPWPTKVLIPEGLVVGGGVLADQVRSLDRAERGFRYLGRAPAELLWEVRSVLARLIGLPLIDLPE